MYVPPHFAVEDPALLESAMRANPFATLVTCGPGGLMANHVPLLYTAQSVASGATPGTLHGHVSRANPQWREIESGTEVLAIFSGPHAYVSPSAYASKRETGRVVPTWNYVVVHAYATGQTYDDPQRLHDLVSRLTTVHESARAEPWAVGDAPESYIAGQLRGHRDRTRRDALTRQMEAQSEPQPSRSPECGRRSHRIERAARARDSEHHVRTREAPFVRSPPRRARAARLIVRGTIVEWKLVEEREADPQAADRRRLQFRTIEFEAVGQVVGPRVGTA